MRAVELPEWCRPLRSRDWRVDKCASRPGEVAYGCLGVRRLGRFRESRSVTNSSRGPRGTSTSTRPRCRRSARRLTSLARDARRDAGPIESEHAAVARIVELRRADCSYPEIATALDAEGHKPRPAASVGSVVGTSLRGRSLAERGQEALHPSGEHLVCECAIDWCSPKG